MATIPPTGSPQDGATVRRSTAAFIDAGYILGNRYEIRCLLGRGAMGEVWLAFDLKLRVEVALKDLTFRRDDREMIRREVRSARDVMSPNVCRVFDLVEADGRELLSMEYVDGMTLRQVIEERSPLDLPEAQAIASQLLAGLDSIHAAGLVHRDLKPENVMITRTGRVVIMDFGLARESKSDSGSIAGTPAYMSPEQARGDPMDPRTDIFAAGVLLAELVNSTRTREARTSIWEGIRQRPAQIPEGPWAAALGKAVSRDRSERYESAREMARALEQVTLRVAAAEDQRPYPGLTAFTEQHTEFFFGREAEVEAMLRKLERFHLLALIGHSGAGKSSFLRAGIIPMLPKSWSVLFCHPGNSPFASLGQALAPKIEEPGLAGEMVRFQEPDIAVSLLRRWRTRHEQALIVIDQFEELFTLNPAEVQARFAELLGGAVVDADVRILLSLRDDFLVDCHEHEPLAPIFSELTPLRAPSGPALRRVVVQPALRCGYRFEDESLVESMLAEVGEERGTLPLLAFAAAQLWERRDRQGGLLTQEAYGEIGGVSGALAQHAEQTLARIGSERIGIVREIFRNLVTAKGTRAARDREDLLSVFSDRVDAGEVLDLLIEARLLTSFEQRIEIVHESLLTAWPRLLQWRAQEAEGAILRDQLRQAAQLWHERGRPDELLWSGNSYREFLVWRTRYTGGLSALEEGFAIAMTAHVERRKRRTRMSMVAVIAVALAIAAVTTSFWRQSVASQRQARAESLRAEAAKLLALAQVELERFPTAALAYATKSLEIHDTPEARRFALEVLWRGPTAFVLPWQITNGAAIDFTHDGKWLSFVGNMNDDFLVPEDGGPAVKLNNPSTPVYPIAGFDPSGRYLIAGTQGSPEVRIFSVPDGVERRVLRFEQETFPVIGGRQLLTLSTARTSPPRTWIIRSSSYDGGAVSVAGTFAARGEAWAVSRDGSWVAVRRENVIYRRSVAAPFREELLWRPSQRFDYFSFSADGRWIFGVNREGLTVRSLESETERRLVFPGAKKTRVWLGPVFDRSHSLTAWSDGSGSDYVWDRSGPPDADARVLRHGLGQEYLGAAFHPKGEWLATVHHGGVGFWPLRQPTAGVVAGGQEFSAVRLSFTPHGEWLAVCAPVGGVSLIPLHPHSGQMHTSAKPAPFCQGLALHPNGREFLASGFESGVFLVPTDGAPRALPNNPALPLRISGAAMDRTGRFAAVTLGGRSVERTLRVWDLQTHREQRFALPAPTSALAFAYDGGLYSAGTGGIRRWDIQTGENRIVHAAADIARMTISGDGRLMLATVQRSAARTPEKNEEEHQELRLFDLKAGTSREITTHGSKISSIALDQTGQIVMTGDGSGVVRVGRAAGEVPHLLLGHQGEITAVASSFDGRMIASAAKDGTIRLWPAPDLFKVPLHTIAHNELIAKLRSLTNVRAVRSDTSPTGYRVAYDRFPGWKNPPTW